MKEHYAVVEIDTMNVVYQGDSLASAATCLEPGTVYGKGFNEESALLNAKSVVKTILDSILNFSKKKRK